MQEHREVEGAVVEAIAHGRLTREVFSEGVEALFGAERVAGWDAEYRRHGELLSFVEGTRQLREALVQRLVPHGLVVYGDEYWARVTEQRASFVDYAGGGVAAHFRACPVNLNTTSIQMASAVNQRVFDCPAAGGFLLTDGQGDIGELFDTGEMATYTNLDEAEALLQKYMGAPGERVAMVEKARKRVLGEHTYGHRLEAIAGMLKERFGG